MFLDSEEGDGDYVRTGVTTKSCRHTSCPPRHTSCPSYLLCGCVSSQNHLCRLTLVLMDNCMKILWVVGNYSSVLTHKNIWWTVYTHLSGKRLNKHNHTINRNTRRTSCVSTWLCGDRSPRWPQGAGDGVWLSCTTLYQKPLSSFEGVASITLVNLPWYWSLGRYCHPSPQESNRTESWKADTKMRNSTRSKSGTSDRKPQTIYLCSHSSGKRVLHRSILPGNPD